MGCDFESSVIGVLRRPCYVTELYTVSHPFYICDNLIRRHPIMPMLGGNVPPGNLKQPHINNTPHINFIWS